MENMPITLCAGNAKFNNAKQHLKIDEKEMRWPKENGGFLAPKALSELYLRRLGHRNKEALRRKEKMGLNTHPTSTQMHVFFSMPATLRP
eukprot:1159611-Pelagomonas_calceolata.AAC.1